MRETTCRSEARELSANNAFTAKLRRNDARGCCCGAACVCVCHFMAICCFLRPKRSAASRLHARNSQAAGPLLAALGGRKRQGGSVDIARPPDLQRSSKYLSFLNAPSNQNTSPGRSTPHEPPALSAQNLCAGHNAGPPCLALAREAESLTTAPHHLANHKAQCSSKLCNHNNNLGFASM